MTVDQVRPKIDYRQDGQRRLGEESIFFNLKKRVVTVGLKAVKEHFVVDKIVFNPVLFRIHDAYILIFPMEVHIKMGDVAHLVFHRLGHAGILG